MKTIVLVMISLVAIVAIFGAGLSLLEYLWVSFLDLLEIIFSSIYSKIGDALGVDKKKKERQRKKRGAELQKKKESKVPVKERCLQNLITSELSEAEREEFYKNEPAIRKAINEGRNGALAADMEKIFGNGANKAKSEKKSNEATKYSENMPEDLSTDQQNILNLYENK